MTLNHRSRAMPSTTPRGPQFADANTGLSRIVHQGYDTPQCGRLPEPASRGGRP